MGYKRLARPRSTRGMSFWYLTHSVINTHDGVMKDEQDLASIDGMNFFAACVILCQNSLQDFLDLTSEERVSQFGRLVGQERMVMSANRLDRTIR